MESQRGRTDSARERHPKLGLRMPTTTLLPQNRDLGAIGIQDDEPNRQVLARIHVLQGSLRYLGRGAGADPVAGLYAGFLGSNGSGPVSPTAIPLLIHAV